MRTPRKFLPLLLLLGLLVPLLAGCMGGVPELPADVPTAKDPKQQEINEHNAQLRADLVGALYAVDQMNSDQLVTLSTQLRGEIAAVATKEKKTEAEATALALKQLTLGYTLEQLGMLKTPVDRALLDNAVAIYRGQQNVKPYGSVAAMRIAQVDGFLWVQQTAEHNPEQAKNYRQSAVRALEQFSYSSVKSPMPGVYVRERSGLAGWPVPLLEEDLSDREKEGMVALRKALPAAAEWRAVPSRKQANAWLDPYFRDTWQYRVFDVLVALCSWAGSKAKYILAIFLIAILAKLITTPFSVAQFRSMRAMQLFQPEMKKLQEKYKDDKQGLAKAQMELMKEHKINPASSCLPTIVQMVILIQVYYGIRHYIWPLQGVNWLYLESLAYPDTITLFGTAVPGPILVLYAASMYFTQKLIAMPSGNPEQAQQQRMMAIMMPFLMLMIMQTQPSAFILYWFLQNVLMTGHQYLIMRPHREADAAAAAQAAAESAKTKGETQQPAPPEVLERLSQESKPKKKKKRRY